MGRLIGIVLIVLGIWVGLEVYQKGTEHAFGGALAGFGSSQAPRDERSTARRAGDAVGGAHADSDARRERLLAE